MKRGPDPVALSSVALVGVLVVVACTSPAPTGNEAAANNQKPVSNEAMAASDESAEFRAIYERTKATLPRARPRLFHAHELVVRRWEVRNRSREGLCTCREPPGANAVAL